MFGNRVLRIIRKGETNVPLYKIGHISENTFGKDSKTYTNVKYGPSAVLSQKKNIWVLILFYGKFYIFSYREYR